jgi:hypothetical protein
MRLLDMQAAADGLVHDHLRLHRAGKETRRTRGVILAISAACALALLAAMWRFAPWWAWAALIAVVFPPLARAGRPASKPIVGQAALPSQGQPPSPEVITRALGALGSAEINKVVREGREITFPAPVREDGPGWRAEVDLPYGVTATQVIERREQLASGLRRPLGAVWPEPVSDEHTGRLELWVGRTDISKAKPPPWPLLRSGQADVFAPMPFGIDVRGRTVTAPLIYHNWLDGSISRQGKTSAVRLKTSYIALDPLCEQWIHELKGSGDLDLLEQVCHRFTSGIHDEAMAYTAESLRLLRSEIERRTGRVKKLPREVCPDKRVTRQIAAKRGLRLWPVACTVDEAQNLFLSRFGRQAGRRRRRVHHQDRPGVRGGADPGHPAPRQGLAAQGDQRQRLDPVLPQGDGPGRKRHDPRHLGLQERHPGHHLPPGDRRRDRLLRRRGPGAAGGAHLLPGHARHRADRRPRPARARRNPLRRRGTCWPTCSPASAATTGCTGSRSPNA